MRKLTREEQLAIERPMTDAELGMPDRLALFEVRITRTYHVQAEDGAQAVRLAETGCAAEVDSLQEGVFAPSPVITATPVREKEVRDE